MAAYANVPIPGETAPASPMYQNPNANNYDDSESDSAQIPTETINTYGNNQFLELAKMNADNSTNPNGIEESFTIGEMPNDDPGKGKHKMFYEIEDVPSWFLTLFLGFQHYLLAAGATLSLPLLLMRNMCMDVDEDRNMGNIISTFLFVGGIITIMQTTFGTRLPIVQGGSFAFVIPALAILNTDRWKCPANLLALGQKERTEVWQLRMREIQGAIIIASLLQIALGFFGIFGIIMKFITPITLASSVIVIGLSLFEAGTGLSSTSWPISLTTMILVIIFSQYLRDVKIPIPFTKSKKRNGMLRYPMFQIFPVLLSMIVVWAVCAILTVSGAFPAGYAARTDIKWKLVLTADYFRVPFPFQWGLPTFTAGAAVGFLSAVFAGIVESLGEYQATARIVRAPKPPVHSTNRGVFIEGVGCLLCGLFGTGNGTTSYSGNTGAMSVTKVGSRRVVQTAGFIMMVFSLSGTVGAFFVAVPDPIIGGILCVTFAMIIAVGISNLQNVDLTSSRNMFILGFSIFFALATSQWVGKNKSLVKFGFSEDFDYTVQILFSTGMFVAALTSVLLDNTIPGTDQERGLVKPTAGSYSKPGGGDYDMAEDEEEATNVTYDLPFGMKFIRRFAFASYIPISPTFKGFPFEKNK